MSETQTNTQMTDDEIDSTYDALTNGNPTPDLEVDAPPTQTQAEPVISFDHQGKKIDLPMNDPRVKQWLSQGHDYNTHISKLKSDREAFETERKQIEALKTQYGPVDDWVKQNPDAWNKFLQQYTSAQNGRPSEIDPSNPLVQYVQKLEEKLEQQLGQFKPVVEHFKTTQEQAQDKALDTEIESVRKQYPDLDLEAKDAEGRTRLYRVYEFANQNGIKNFTTAFKALNHDELVKLAMDKGKESELKARQKQTKLGLLTDKSAPKRGVKSAQNYRDKSYDQLIQEGLDELSESS